jgi:hypothetical protein
MVADGERAAYHEAWASLHAAATATGAHAWRFVSARTPGLFLEFLEFASDGGLREDPGTLAAIARLHEGFGDPYPPPDTLEEWNEIPHADS